MKSKKSSKPADLSLWGCQGWTVKIFSWINYFLRVFHPLKLSEITEKISKEFGKFFKFSPPARSMTLHVKYSQRPFTAHTNNFFWYSTCTAPYAACALAWDFLAKSCLDDHLIVKKNENMKVPVWRTWKRWFLSHRASAKVFRSITFVSSGKSMLEVFLGIHLTNYKTTQSNYKTHDAKYTKDFLFPPCLIFFILPSHNSRERTRLKLHI